jgi:hypothetical protein
MDSPTAWPGILDLNGLTYSSLQGASFLNTNPLLTMAARSTEWFREWLGKQEYAPAPYYQLASVLRGLGRIGAADEILYFSKDLERKNAMFWNKIWLTAIKYTIGYGFYVEWTLYWIVGLLIVGVGVIWYSGEGLKNEISRFGIAYSFDMLLPIIKPREEHYKIELSRWPRKYFYVHKVMGLILASLLVAGISGLTK